MLQSQKLGSSHHGRSSAGGCAAVWLRGRGGGSALPASAGALGCLVESRISVHSSGLAEAPQPLDSRMVH